MVPSAATAITRTAQSTVRLSSGEPAAAIRAFPPSTLRPPKVAVETNAPLGITDKSVAAALIAVLP